MPVKIRLSGILRHRYGDPKIKKLSSGPRITVTAATPRMLMGKWDNFPSRVRTMTIIGDPGQHNDVNIATIPVKHASGRFKLAPQFRDWTYSGLREQGRPDPHDCAWLKFILSDKDGFSIEAEGEYELFAHVDEPLVPGQKHPKSMNMFGNYIYARIYTGVRPDLNLLRVRMDEFCVPKGTKKFGLSLRVGPYETAQRVVPFTGKPHPKFTWALSPVNREFYTYHTKPNVALHPVVRALSRNGRVLGVMEEYFSLGTFNNYYHVFRDGSDMPISEKVFQIYFHNVDPF